MSTKISTMQRYDTITRNINDIQRLHRWSLGMDPTLYNGCNYLSMLWLKLNDVSKRCPRYSNCPYWQVGFGVDFAKIVSCKLDQRLLRWAISQNIISWMGSKAILCKLLCSWVLCLQNLWNGWAKNGSQHDVTVIYPVQWLTQLWCIRSTQ